MELRVDHLAQLTEAMAKVNSDSIMSRLNKIAAEENFIHQTPVYNYGYVAYPLWISGSGHYLASSAGRSTRSMSPKPVHLSSNKDPSRSLACAAASELQRRHSRRLPCPTLQFVQCLIPPGLFGWAFTVRVGTT